jgi:hypothetical protein
MVMVVTDTVASQTFLLFAGVLILAFFQAMKGFATAKSRTASHGEMVGGWAF